MPGPENQGMKNIAKKGRRPREKVHKLLFSVALRLNADNKKIGSVLAIGKDNGLALAVLRKEEITIGDTLFTETGAELAISKEQPYALES